MRWLHGAAAIVWIGGALFELLILPRGADEGLSEAGRQRLQGARRDVEQTSLFVFLVSGVILAFDRLSHNAAGGAYALVLGLKLVIVVAVFQLAFRLRRPGNDQARARWIGGLGLLVVFASALLKSLYERALVG
jgi:uncharacterized membrane protein